MRRALSRAPGAAAIASILSAASAYCSGVKSLISTPARQRSTSASESPMPVLIINGKPHARYSPFLVGDDASFETQRLMNDRPASAAARYEGTSAAGTDNTL